MEGCVQFLATAAGRFSASHRLDEDPRHHLQCGHSYEVLLVEEVRFNESTHMPAATPEELQIDLAELLIELDGKHLNDQLVGTPPTLAGIAGWIMERSLMRHPNLVACEVQELDSDLRMTVRREVRRT
jgi:6-pyruvoyl-tetrahydropterin synthase